MRVALVVTDLQRGGAPLRLSRLARRLRDAGVNVHVGCLAAPGPLSAELERDGIPTFAAGARTVWDIGAIRRLSRAVAKIRPDLIHSTLTHANVACRWIGRRLGIPVVSSTATIEVERAWHAWAERWTATWDRGHLVNCAALADHVRSRFRVPNSRIFTIPPCVDPWPTAIPRDQARKTLGLPNDAFVTFWAGRFDPVKRVDWLVDCAAQTTSSRWVVLLAGDGAQREAIQRRIQRENLATRVRLTGWLEDLSAALSAADVFAFPSLTEGMPGAVLTAMAAGVPVAASDIPAHRELAGDAGRIHLVSGDQRAWLSALQQLEVDAGRRATLADAARAWAAANLDPARTTAETISAYRKALRPPEPAGA
ncbi:MAG: glycosyltransferase [Planctomycetes bacterium]|nr:glycosyltransferase [Planctomycetota bacterium]